MTKKLKGFKVMTPKFRMSFPHLLQPYAFDDEEPKYMVTMMFPPDADLSEIKDKAKRVAKENFKKVTKELFKHTFTKGKNQKNPENFKGFEDWKIMKPKSGMKPGLVDEDVEEVIDPAQVYSGRWARAVITAFTYDTKGNKGVSFSLDHVQLLDHDDRLDGRGNAKDYFDEENFDENDLDEDDEDMFE